MMTRFYSPAKHLLIGLALVFCGSTASMAQGVVNDGAKINITASTYFIIDNGGFDNRVNGAVTNAGTMDVDGDWLNADANGVFGLTPTTGTVRLDGGTQYIGGTVATHFNNLNILGSGKKTLDGVDASVHNILNLSNQSIRLNSKTLTLENASLNSGAIVNSGGFVISESLPSTGAYGVLKWNITTTGNYVIPFGTDDPSPSDVTFRYNISVLGTPSTTTFKTFATYRTNAENSFLGGPIVGPYTPTVTYWSDLPFNVTHLTDDYIQASHYWVIDRFWIIDEGNLSAPPGYSAKPRIEYIFKYDENEATALGNHIDQTKLVPQRYNHLANTWGDWFYGVPATITDVNANTVKVQIAQDHPIDPIGHPNTWLEDMYPVWTLVDNSDPLPIELVRFAGECGDGSIELKWTTWTETNNDFFTVERSNNGTDFEIVDVIEGAGNSNQSITYNAIDNLPYGGTSYYRLKNTDFTGKSEYSEIIAVTCGTDGNDFNFVNAYDVDQTDIVVEFTAADNEKFTIFLYDAAGRRALDFSGEAVDGMNKVRLPSGNLARGIYIINLSNAQRNFSKRVMLH